MRLKKFNSQKGVTLIALIVTIIVLVILAGVTISSLIGDDGIVVETQVAAEDTQKATAKDELVLAWSNLDLQYWKAKAQDNNIQKSDYFNLENLNSKLKGKGVVQDITFDKNGNANVKYVSNSSQIAFDFTVDNAGEVLLVGTDNGNGNTTTTPKPNPQKQYLVDVVEIGDYVDIGIDYENQGSYGWGGDLLNISQLTGWRVLSKTGTGATGTVKLVSAGCPLNYNHLENGENQVKALENLYNEGLFSDDKYHKTGFSSANLNNIFTTDKYIDVSKGIHALGCGKDDYYGGYFYSTAYSPIDEIEQAYKIITGQNIVELDSTDLSTATLKKLSGNNWKESYKDLLDNGQCYWLGGRAYSGNYAYYSYFVNHNGHIDGSYHKDCQAYGVRPVVSLQSGVKVSSNNIGNGLSSSSAYSITK